MLYIRRKQAESTEEFAMEVFRLLKISDWEQRESENRAPVDGIYYLGRAMALEIGITTRDEAINPDTGAILFGSYNFMAWISTDRVWLHSEAIHDGVPDLIARRLAIAGYAVARDTYTEQIILYEVSEDPDEKLIGKTITANVDHA